MQQKLIIFYQIKTSQNTLEVILGRNESDRTAAEVRG